MGQCVDMPRRALAKWGTLALLTCVTRHSNATVNIAPMPVGGRLYFLDIAPRVCEYEEGLRETKMKLALK